MDTDNDSFWAEFASVPFFKAIEEHSKALVDVENRVTAIKQRTGTNRSTGGETTALLSTVNSLPQLLEKQKLLERHSQVLRAIMDIIAARSVYKLSGPEEELLFHHYADEKALLELAVDPELTFRDKVRMGAVFVLSCYPLQDIAEELENAILGCVESQTTISESEREVILNFIQYVKKVYSIAKLNRHEDGVSSQSFRQSKQSGNSNIWDIANLTQKALINASRQVKSFVGEKKLMRAISMMRLACKEASSESIIAEQDSQFLYFDPKISGIDPAPSNARINSGFSEGTLFVVGSGCALEYQNLQDLAAGKFPLSRSSEKSKNLKYVYGCSELVNADNFLEQLASCC